jgi:hypothetical protein
LLRRSARKAICTYDTIGFYMVDSSSGSNQRDEVGDGVRQACKLEGLPVKESAVQPAPAGRGQRPGPHNWSFVMPIRTCLRPFLAVALFAGVAATAAARPPRVVSSNDLADYWVMSNASLDADVPVGGRNMSAPGCATVSFVIGPDGRTSQAKVQKVAPPSDLGKVALSMATHLTFRPAAANAQRHAVFSWMIFPFNLPDDPAARTRVMQGCAVNRLGWKDR